MVTIRCDDCGFDCKYTTAGKLEQVVYDYWDHMSTAHGIEYSPETLAKYVLKKIPTKIPAS
jgi:predicted small metal-binding protein